LTRQAWGSLARTYIVCKQDMALRPTLQEKFIADADNAYPDNRTAVALLDASHSPFLSRPRELADILLGLG
jgi:hypothetical protein